MGEDGFPVSLPTRFVVDTLQPKCQANTIEAYLRAILYFYRWAGDHSPRIDLESRLRSGELLTTVEALSFAAYLMKGPEEKIAPFSGSRLHPNVFNSYLLFVRKFLCWAAEAIANPCPTERQIEGLKTRMAASEVRWTRDQSRRGLTNEQRAEFMAQIAPSSQTNPFNRPARFRNYTVVRVLLETGIRRGELCKLRVADVHTKGGASYLEVVRRPDDPDDPRRAEPNVKTRGRTIPISDDLKALLVEYMLRHRGRAKHPYLFTVPHSGDPISVGLPNTIIARAKRTNPQLSDVRISPHIFRHTFEGDLSKKLEESTYTEAEQVQIRNYVSGWSENSQQAAGYDRLRIEQLTFELIKKSQVPTVAALY
jgi:integrase